MSFSSPEAVQIEAPAFLESSVESELEEGVHGSDDCASRSSDRAQTPGPPARRAYAKSSDDRSNSRRAEIPRDRQSDATGSRVKRR